MWILVDVHLRTSDDVEILNEDHVEVMDDLQILDKKHVKISDERHKEVLHGQMLEDEI